MGAHLQNTETGEPRFLSPYSPRGHELGRSNGSSRWTDEEEASIGWKAPTDAWTGISPTVPGEAALVRLYCIDPKVGRPRNRWQDKWSVTG